LSPVVVLGINAISSSLALINRAQSHLDSANIALSRSTGQSPGRARSRLHAANSATLRAGIGPIEALLR
jgi:hypothetical protein